MLSEDDVRWALLRGIARAQQTLPFEVDAWVLLPGHLHCLWTLPPEDNNFSARWAIIKRQLSRFCGSNVPATVNESRKKRRELGVWQRRFWEHLIRDEAYYRRHTDYIHWNPVKHG